MPPTNKTRARERARNHRPPVEPLEIREEREQQQTDEQGLDADVQREPVHGTE
jgi:hypothetical protein